VQKTFLYLGILALLGFGVWFFLFSEKSGNLFRTEDASFGVHDTASIGKIFISANDAQNTIMLERRADGWILNDKYPVLASTLKQLMNTIYNQKAIYPVPDVNRNDVIRSLIGGAIKTEIYDVKGRKIRTFYVGGEVHGFAGTAMLMDGSERPYVVQMPGFDGYLTTRYSIELGMWRDRLVFGIPADQIEKLQIKYAQEPLNSFTIVQKNGKANVILDSSLHFQSALNERRVASYLDFFKKVYAEGYSNGSIDLDTIVKQMPEKATIELWGAKGYHKFVRLIFYPIDRRSKNMEAPIRSFDDRFHQDRYFAILNDGADTATVQIPTFEKILRRGYEFYTPDVEGTTTP
jgi:hypothetical protein